MTEPTQLVEQFLARLCDGELDEAAEMLAPNVVYSNVSLPTVRGRERVRRLLHLSLGRSGMGFEAYTHAISAAGQTVLTERTDALTLGRLRVQFWVCGRFDIEDGEIVLWRDRFDWMNSSVATLRGLIGVFVPALRAAPPR